MSNTPLPELKKLYIELQVNAVMSQLDQILKSPEMISEINQLNPTQINEIKQKEQDIVSKSTELEFDYLVKKHKIKISDELYDLIDKMPSYEIMNLRKKFIMEVINNLNK